MSAGKVLAQVSALQKLLSLSTPPPWAEDGTLVGPELYECDASADEDGQGFAWASFKTNRADTDRAVWIHLRNNAEALLELKRAAAAWAVALHQIHGKTFTGPGPHYELEAFQKREHDLAELALVVLEGIE